MSGVPVLFVGFIQNGREEILPRAFPSHTFRQHVRNGTFEDTIFDLDLTHYEPYVYVQRGLKAQTREWLYEQALREVKARRERHAAGRELAISPF